MRFYVLFIFFVFQNNLAQAKTLEDIWNDFDLKTDKSFKKSTNIGGFLVQGESGYAYSVKKVFLKSDLKFQRTDGYVLNLGFGYGVTDYGRLGLKGEAQVTYVRNFDNKFQAVSARPQFTRAFPKKASDVLENSRGLKVGDSVRIEFSSGSSLSTGISKLFERALIDDFSILNSVGASASVHRGTKFLIDVYRLSEGKIRLKMLAVRDSGTVSGGLNASSALLASAGVPLAEAVIKRLVSCHFSLHFSKKVSRKKPTDSLMADYVINLKTAKGSLLYDQFMKGLFTAQISKHINLFKSSQEFEDSLTPHMTPIDFESFDYLVYGDEAPVRRLFKGRMLSDSSSLGASGDCFKLFGLHNMKFKNLSSLRSYDDFDRPTDYLMYNLGVDKDGVFDDHTNNYHHIWTAKRENPEDPLSVKPVDLNTLTLNKIVEDKFSRGKRLLWFLPGEHESLINEMVNLYPFQINKDHFKEAFEKNSVNLVSNLKISLNKTIIDSMRSPGIPYTRRWALETVEDLQSVGVYFPLGDGQGRGRGKHHLDTYVSSLAPIVSPSHLDYISEVRGLDEQGRRDYVFSHYNRLLNSQLFRQIGFSYLMSLADPVALNENLSFNYTLAVGKKLNKKDFQIDIRGPESDVSLKSLEVLRIINSRTFDLSIEQ